MIYEKTVSIPQHAVTPASIDRRYTSGRLALYLVLSFGLAWALELIVPLTHASLNSLVFKGIALGAMLCPALAATVALWGCEMRWGDAGLGFLFKRNWRAYITAYLLPIGLVVVATAATLVLGWAHLDLTMPALQPLLHNQTKLQGLAPILVIQTVTVGTVFGVPFAMGEELGWRGYLLPALLRRGLSPHKALIVSGIIWGLWHAPLILMGYNYPDTPVLGVALFCVFTTLVGYVFGWLRLTSGTTWTAALSHASLDQTISATSFLLAPGYNSSLGTIVGVIGWVPLALVVLWLVVTGRIRRLHLPSPTPVHKEAPDAPAPEETLPNSADAAQPPHSKLFVN